MSLDLDDNPIPKGRGRGRGTGGVAILPAGLWSELNNDKHEVGDNLNNDKRENTEDEDDRYADASDEQIPRGFGSKRGGT